MTLLFVATTIINLSFWILYTTLISLHKSQKKKDLDKSVDVLVCAKNQGDKLNNLINKLTKQKGISSLIIANDFSEDNSASILKNIEAKNAILKSFVPSKDATGKKIAIIEGISRVKASLLAFTDADCLPINDLWLVSMYGQLEDFDAVLGYSPMLKSKRLVNSWQRWETAFIAMQYMGMAKLRLAYMGVGRNLLFRRDSLKTLGLVDLKPELSGGDDDFLVQSISKNKVTINLDPDSFVFTESSQSWRDYIQQKQRHLSTSPHYPALIKFILMLFSVSHVIWYICFFLCLNIHTVLAFNALVIRWFIIYFCQYFNTRKLAISDLWKWTAVFDVALTFFFIFFAIFFKPKANW